MSTMTEALKSAGIQKSKQPRTRRTYTPNTEGVDHVNVGPCSKYPWAVRLWKGTYSFTHPVLGPFPTLNSYMLYVSSTGQNRENFRSMSASKVNQIIEKHRDRIYRDFSRELEDGYRCILAENDKLLKDVAESNMPYVSYALFNAKANENGLAIPVTERANREVGRAFKEIRRFLREGNTDLLEGLKGDYKAIIKELEALLATPVTDVEEEEPAVSVVEAIVPVDEDTVVESTEE